MLDRDEIERRRFARLLGTDGAAGFGLPIGGREHPEKRNAGGE